MLASCIAVKPCIAAAEPLACVPRPADLWISPDAYRQHFSPYTYAGNDPINRFDPDGNFDLSKEFRENYPKSAALLDNIALNSKKEAAFLKYGQASKPAVEKALTPGKGPAITPNVFLNGDHGQYDPSNKNNIGINILLLRDVEDGKAGASGLLSVTAQHELVHYFDDKDNVDYPGEEGWLFEFDVWGKGIKNYEDAQCLEFE
jgi:hypothetical protein